VGRKPATCSLNTGPYCKARKRLPLRLVQRLSQAVAERLSARQAEHWKWRGREIKLVDGTTVSMPDTVDNRKNFPRSKGQKRAQLPAGTSGGSRVAVVRHRGRLGQRPIRGQTNG